MWIIPQNLHTSAYVPDTGALILDLNELSEALEPSLLVRSKPTRSQTWSRKLKTDTWTRRLYGRTLKPSHGEHFAGAWTFSAVASLVSHLVKQDGEQEMTTPATYGPTLSEGLESWADLPLFSSKTSREYLAQASAVQGGATPPARRFCNISSASWSAWITERRREYLARLKLAPRISASAYLSLPSDQTSAQTDTDGLESCWRTPTAQESGKGSKGDLTDKSGEPWTGEGSAYFNGQVAQITLDQQVYADARGAIYGPQDEAPDSTLGSPRASHPESREILNPRWVEVLMGVPVGWVMATCDAPLTAAQMSLDFWAMELYPPQQSEPLGCCGES